jgi:hypothetical protein
MEKFEELVGKTLTTVSREGDESITFVDSDGFLYQMFHEQDCCEGVFIEDVNGDLNDLVGEPILMAAEVSQSSDHNEASTWTFYHLATSKGYVTIRWYGVSNGYYSTEVTFKQISK